MKIEKINDNQIRCTLDKLDLVSRQININELAYGSEKARKLFSEMMQKASFELGFEADDIPIMIEAIPISSEALIIVITKIEEPDELDTRFSKFTSHNISDEDDFDDEYPEEYLEEDYAFASSPQNATDNVKDILDLYQQYKQSGIKKQAAANTAEFQLYTFNDLDTLIRLSKNLSGIYKGKSSLYKNPHTDKYQLMLYGNTSNSYEALISEYRIADKTTYASKAYLDEHAKILIKDKAIKQLAKV